MRLRPLLLDTVYPNIHLLIVERDVSRDLRALHSRQFVPPHEPLFLARREVDVVVVSVALIRRSSTTTVDFMSGVITYLVRAARDELRVGQ